VLCINQAEDDYALKERNSQVQQMGAIYRDADGVFAWLGPADIHSDIVMNEINNGGHNVFNRALQLFPNQIGKEATLDTYKLGRIALSHLRLDTLISDTGWESALLPASWESWRAFLARPYWTRLWILQELLLAKECYLLCGEAKAPIGQLLILIPITARSKIVNPNNRGRRDYQESLAS
jgi:hypothetical protein